MDGTAQQPMEGTSFNHTFEDASAPSGMIPRVYGRSYAIEAELSVPGEGAEGVIVAEADEMGGFSLWVDEMACCTPATR